MHLDSDDEARLTRYLLGQLSQDEQEALEERFFSDPEYFEQILAAEDALLDEYVSGRLAAADRVAFERQWLASPEGRQELEIARLTRSLFLGSTLHAPAAPSTHPGIVRGRSLFRLPAAAQWAVVAATIALAIGGSWLYARVTHLTRELSRLREARGLLEQQLDEVTVAAKRDRDRLMQLQAELRRAGEERGTIPQPARRQFDGTPAVLSFVLTARPTRAPESSQRLLIPRAAATIQLQIPLQADAERATYGGSVRTPEGEQGWSATGIPPLTNPLRVVLSVPSAALRAGDYIVTVTAPDREGGVETLDSRAFSVRRP